ncbi:MAG: hypothetical protein QF903_12480 [Planctomycetota bacterium]|jgi:hypothetical protein|nr:hypothetical protein [Planctomycetota bacterium]MDP6762654.1 hypothetical protein [Planctomycetota bacterium]MDP6990277.1 hypothetical protein [Planctomycetota bacterium]
MALHERPDQPLEPLPDAQGPFTKHSIAEELHLPLAALRASVEALARECPPDDPQAERFDGVVAQVVRIGRRVQNLIDFSHPPPLRPLPCSIEEIVRGAVEVVPEKHRCRVIFAIDERTARLTVDGPLLARALGGLLEAVVDDHGEALLHARSSGGVASFGIRAQGPPRRFPAPSGRARIGESLARREVARMGGAISETTSRLGTLGLTVRILSQGAPGGAA